MHFLQGKELNAEVPCARADIKLMYNDKKGRFFVAAEDIPAGKAFNFCYKLMGHTKMCRYK